jgi:Na+-driven multidrug efflux pump
MRLKLNAKNENIRLNGYDCDYISFGSGSDVLIMIPGVLLCGPLLNALAVPQEIFSITSVYVRITFLGVPLTFIYNALAAAMKSVGDSARPLRFLAVSSVLNIALDLLLLGVFHFGIAVSALTTVFAQLVCAFLAWQSMNRDLKQLVPEKEEWKTDRGILKRVMNYGLPSAMQQAVQPIGKLLIQSQVNLLGVSTIAAFNAVSRIDSFAFENCDDLLFVYMPDSITDIAADAFFGCERIVFLCASDNAAAEYAKFRYIPYVILE